MIFGTKIALEAVLADFGQARGGQNGGKMAELGAKMEPRWRQDGPSWAPDRHLEATGGAILAILKGLGADFGKNGRHVKMSITMAFWPHFGVLGGLVGGSWGLFWVILAKSWALLGDLGVKLGTSWQHVGTEMGKDGLRWPT